MDYPILVERWDDKHPADMAVCESCGDSFTWDPGQGDPYDMCAEHTCGGSIVMKYDEGVRCKGCGKLDYSMPTRDGCCSRACSLQAEYAAQLATNQKEVPDA